MMQTPGASVYSLKGLDNAGQVAGVRNFTYGISQATMLCLCAQRGRRDGPGALPLFSVSLI